MGIKLQVQVAAHTSAKVILNSEGMLLRLSPASSFAGKTLLFPASNEIVRPIYFLPLFTLFEMIAQRLR
jgi:hypothetical protein